MKNEATKELTLADFQQQVAKDSGFNDWEHLTNDSYSIKDVVAYFNEAAEAYAAYKFEQGYAECSVNASKFIKEAYKNGFEQGKQEGEAKWIKPEIKLPYPFRSVLLCFEKESKGMANVILIGHFDGVDWSARGGNPLLTNKVIAWMEIPIFNGLKQEEESRSELLNCKFCKSQHVYRYTCGNMVGFAKCKDCKKEFEI